MKEIIFSQDNYKMNWIRSDFEYAQVSCPKELECSVLQEQEGDIYTTSITLRNRTDKPFFSNRDSIAIRFPLQDKYESSEICIPYRCNTHIFCGGSVSYIMALRMGGEAPHLGMVLTQGSLDCYSIERDLKQQSNDRGCFLLHPSPMEWGPGEETTIRWTIFPHKGREDFEEKLKQYSRYVKVEADHYVSFVGESIKLSVQPSFEAPSVKCNEMEMQQEQGGWQQEYCFMESGEQVFDIRVGAIHTWCKVYVQEPFEKLVRKRCLFIAQKQQYHGQNEHLQGAYLIYDREEKHIYYDHFNDYNAGRERVGMGILIARVLRCGMAQGQEAELLHSSLKEYLAFVERELVISETGEICNEMGLDNSYQRLYNFPWFVTLFVETYELYQEKRMLRLACKILEEFYHKGGCSFYPIELPICSLDRALEEAGMDQERASARAWFIRHADKLAKTGINYPKSEVNYEQSIVAPAADILLQAYLLTQKEEYLEASRIQLRVLEQFNGFQPDYHLYETAVRHWDGYWFGKNRMFGDTFPHYWSGLTGNVYALYGAITQQEAYFKKAQASLRGVLPMFFPDGTASCAYVYPYRVNGVKAECFDPYANDQDWGLYFYLRLQHIMDSNGYFKLFCIREDNGKKEETTLY